MKKKYVVLPFCTKHKVHHGQKFPSCVLQYEGQGGSSVENMLLPSGAVFSFKCVGPLRAKDIALIYFMLKKVFHNAYAK